MPRPLTRALYRTQNDTKVIETVLVNTIVGSRQLVTKVNGVSIFVPGLTSVMPFTTDIEARKQHTRWVLAVVGKTGEVLEENIGA